MLEVTIEDNGIGRAKAKTNSTASTGKGIEIVDQIIDLYQKLNNTKVEYQVLDLEKEKGIPYGTRVVIKSLIKS